MVDIQYKAYVSLILVISTDILNYSIEHCPNYKLEKEKNERNYCLWVYKNVKTNDLFWKW